MGTQLSHLFWEQCTAEAIAMRVVNRAVLLDFVRLHADVEASVKTWLARTEQAQWKQPQDVLSTFTNASPVGRNRWIFELRHNRYRLDAKIDYRTQTCLIKRAGTHHEYDSWTFDD